MQTRDTRDILFFTATTISVVDDAYWGRLFFDLAAIEEGAEALAGIVACLASSSKGWVSGCQKMPENRDCPLVACLTFFECLQVDVIV